MDWTHWSVDPRLVRALIDRAPDTIKWLEEKGLRFELRPMYPNQSPLIRHAIVGRGPELCRILRNEAERLGATVLTRTRARRLIRDADGPVTGVPAETKDGELVTIAAQTVIIATGGYGNNRELLQQHYPHYHESMTYDGPRGNTGDGITMALEAGAAVAGLGSMNLHGPSSNSRSRADLV
jgi:fumarate reductase flavoprotein subunit